MVDILGRAGGGITDAEAARVDVARGEVGMANGSPRGEIAPSSGDVGGEGESSGSTGGSDVDMFGKFIQSDDIRQEVFPELSLDMFVSGGAILRSHTWAKRGD